MHFPRPLRSSSLWSIDFLRRSVVDDGTAKENPFLSASMMSTGEGDEEKTK